MIVDRTHYVMALWKAGRRIGLPMEFDSLQQAVDQVKSASGKLPDIPIHQIAWNEQINDAEKDGLVIEEIRMRHRPTDLNTAGERVFR